MINTLKLVLKYMTKKTLSEFLELYRNDNTRWGYQSALHTFVEFIYKIEREGNRITNQEKAHFSELLNQYFAESRDYYDDILKFAVSLNDNPPKTAKAYIIGVKEFFAFNGNELTQRQWKTITLKLPKGGARTIEKDMESTIISQILQHTDLKGKALILTLASSGMRLNEALSITREDIDLKANPALITIRGEYTKTGDHRFTFISREAIEALTEWLRVREKYLQSSANRNNGLVLHGKATPKTTKDDRVFPFSDKVAEQLWTTALTNAGLLSIDKSTNRKQLRLHQLRKFFRSQLALGCPVDIVEALMGHEGYLTDAYRRYTKSQMAEYYTKNEHYITIAQNQSIEQIKKEITGEMNEAIKGLVLENQGLQNKNKELEGKLTRLEKAVKVIAKVAMEDPSLLPAMKEFLKP